LKNFTNSKEKYNCTSLPFNTGCIIVFDNNNDGRYHISVDTVLYNSSAVVNDTVITSIPSVIKYFDANNDSRYTAGEPIFNSTDNVIDSMSEMITNATYNTLTLSLTTSNLTLIPDKTYRISVRYYNASNVSEWSYTNPLIYKPGYTATDYNGPTFVSVYDVNATHSEPSSLIDIAYDSDLRFSWTESFALNPERGEYILFYEYALGHAPYPYDGWNSTFGWLRTADGNVRSMVLNTTQRQRLTTANMYYLTVRSLSSFGLYSMNSSSNGIVYNDLTPPPIEIVNVSGDTTYPYEVNVELHSFINIKSSLFYVLD